MMVELGGGGDCVFGPGQIVLSKPGVVGGDQPLALAFSNEDAIEMRGGDAVLCREDARTREPGDAAEWAASGAWFGVAGGVFVRHIDRW